MRQINAVLTIIILILFLFHAVFGGLLLIGVSPNAFKMIARSCEGMIYLHILIGVILTGKSLWTMYKTGTSYFRENKMFWTRRLSGLLIMALMLIHSRTFSDPTAPVYRLQPFTTFKLVLQILFVLSLALHVISNVRPMLISFGLKALKPYEGDILFVLTVILLFFTAAFIIYFLRWQVI